MNLPNKITMARVILIPVFLAALLSPIFAEPANRYAAMAIFVIASLSDFLDGYIARKYKLITNFGKFADPLADKLLVSAALVAFVQLGQIAAWVAVLIISREFIISGLREIAALGGKVLAASYWGKFKTASQMVMVIFLLFGFTNDTLVIIGNILVWLAVLLTLISGVDYIVKNVDVFKE